MKKIILEIAVTLVIVFGVFLGGSLVKNSVQAVDVYKVTTERVEDTVICLGKIEYKESCTINPTTSGIITDVAVKKGDIVKKGDVVFSMITDLNTESVSQLNSSLSQVVDNKTITVKTPVSGTILSVNISADDTVARLSDAIVIVNSQDLSVKLPVSESKISNLRVGQPVAITGSAFEGISYKGVISEIDNVAQQVVTTTGKETAVDVIVDILNPDNKIKQGYSAKCTITTNTKDKSCVLPYNTIEMTDENKGTVYLYQNGRVTKRTVNVGNEYKEGIEVLSGVKENDYVITISENINLSDSVKINKLVENSDVWRNYNLSCKKSAS